MKVPMRRASNVLAGLIALPWSLAVAADNPMPHPGTGVIATPHSYQTLTERLPRAVKSQKMGVVARASATLGAKSIGISIPGNMVVMVFHPRFAVRMLEASVPAGIEAPLRFYITENADGTATLTYRTPSSVFAPYDNADLNAMATELDIVFEQIATNATASSG
jgi:uncharacterized protein (DUF302 family)